MAYLSVNAVDQETCRRLRNRDHDVSTRQAAAVLDCGVAGSDQRVRHFLFSTEADLDAWWSQTVERRERRGIEDGDDAITACADGRAASGAWSTIEGSLSGQVACHRRRDGGCHRRAWTSVAVPIRYSPQT